MSYLSKIEILLPKTEQTFLEEINEFVNLRRYEKQTLYPSISLKEGSVEVPTVRFSDDSRSLCEIPIENITGVNKQSRYTYSLLSLETVMSRVNTEKILGVDHVGFNLPWFEQGIHPQVRELRNILKDQCLYHTFPSGEPWDFILPGSVEEISGQIAVDYTKVRKPKFEIVSFTNCSKPLVQTELDIDLQYSQIVELFPEGIAIEEARNVWVYLLNPYIVDICLVLNEKTRDDWSDYFQNSRLTFQKNLQHLPQKSV